MQLRHMIAVFIFVSSSFWYTQARADFLGLAPGDYTVTLNGSSALCGGSDCVGTVHIGASGATGFDWLFENVGGPANDFDFSHVTHTGSNISPPLGDCAIESFTALNVTNCEGTVAVPLLTLLFNSDTQVRSYATLITGQPIIADNWTAIAIAVPEPLSGSLLLFGLGALGMWRRLRAK